MACDDVPTAGEIAALKLDAATINSVVTSGNELTPTASDGKQKLTLKGLESQYIVTAINGGVWAVGIVFDAYNQYMVYSGVAYRPKSATVLPYTSEATPNASNVEPFDMSSAAGISAVPTSPLTGTNVQELLDQIAPYLILGTENLIINGDMEVWARGDALAQADVDFGPDWWIPRSDSATGGVAAMNKMFDDSEAANYFNLNMSGSPTGHSNIAQTTEGVSKTANKTITISGRVRFSSSETLRLKLKQNFGVGGDSDIDFVDIELSSGVGSSWEDFSHTFTPPSIIGKSIGIDNYLGVFLQIGDTGVAIADGDYDFHAIEMVIGSVSGGSRKRLIGEQRMLCQRYYETSMDDPRSPTDILGRHSWRTENTAIREGVSYKVTKPRAPDIFIFAPASGNLGNITGGSDGDISVSSTAIGINGFEMTATGSTASQSLQAHWAVEIKF